MKKILMILVVVSVFMGCARQQVLRQGGTLAKLESTKSVYVSISRDGKSGRIDYQSSGINTSQIILMVFSKYSKNIETGHQYQSFEKALSYAKKNKYGYLIFPTILEWEDRVTQWSGIPDKILIKIAIIDVGTGKTLDSVIIKGKSRILTFGGNSPQDLLLRPIRNYAKSLFVKH